MEFEIPTTIEGYNELEKWLDSLKQTSLSGWTEALRWYSKNDLFFLHRYILSFGQQPHSMYGTPLYHHQMYVDAARQYERQLTYGSSLDCSARRSGKSEFRSTTIPIHLMLNHPDIAIFILSVEKKLGDRHLIRLMNELERNGLLKHLHDDILWTDPREMAKSQGLIWSRGDGLCIKGRKINRSIQTVEVHALFGGGAIGTGPDVIIADDIERRDRVSSPEAIDELDRAFSEAVTLLTPVVVKQPLLIVSNTRFAENGLIQRLYDRYTAANPDKVREVAAEDTADSPEDEMQAGPLGGRIHYPYTRSFLYFKFEESEDKAEYALQYALTYRPPSGYLPDEKVIWYDFKPEEHAKSMNVYFCIDASRGTKDPTCIWVWGLTPDKRKVWLDAVVRKMDPATPAFHDTLFRLIIKWQQLAKAVIEVRVEDTPNSTWSELISRELRNRMCFVAVVKVKVYAAQVEKKFRSGKADRIYARWAPMLNAGEVWMPKPQSRGGGGINSEDDKGRFRCLVDYFLNVEMHNFPAAKHDDMLDAGGMIADEKTNLERPLLYPTYEVDPEPHLSLRIPGRSWMSGG